MKFQFLGTELTENRGVPSIFQRQYRFIVYQEQLTKVGIKMDH